MLCMPEFVINISMFLTTNIDIENIYCEQNGTEFQQLSNCRSYTPRLDPFRTAFRIPDDGQSTETQ
jgi:hypothetical protein